MYALPLCPVASSSALPSSGLLTSLPPLEAGLSTPVVTALTAASSTLHAGAPGFDGSEVSSVDVGFFLDRRTHAFRYNRSLKVGKACVHNTVPHKGEY